MKIVLSIILSLFATHSFAGVSGSGGFGGQPIEPKNQFKAFQNLNLGKGPQIVFSLNDKGEIKRFQHGTFNGQSWDIEQYTLQDVQEANPAVLDTLLDALKESRETKNWVPVTTFPNNN